MEQARTDVRIYTFRVRNPAPLTTPEGVNATREKLARTSAGYQAAMANPFGILGGGNDDDIPF